MKLSGITFLIKEDKWNNMHNPSAEEERKEEIPFPDCKYGIT
jgi:hypothetical protein